MTTKTGALGIILSNLGCEGGKPGLLAQLRADTNVRQTRSWVRFILIHPTEIGLRFVRNPLQYQNGALFQYTIVIIRLEKPGCRALRMATLNSTVESKDITRRCEVCPLLLPWKKEMTVR